jgi:hypothetical protein
LHQLWVQIDAHHADSSLARWQHLMQSSSQFLSNKKHGHYTQIYIKRRLWCGNILIHLFLISTTFQVCGIRKCNGKVTWGLSLVQMHLFVCSIESQSHSNTV